MGKSIANKIARLSILLIFFILIVALGGFYASIRQSQLSKQLGNRITEFESFQKRLRDVRDSARRIQECEQAYLENYKPGKAVQVLKLTGAMIKQIDELKQLDTLVSKDKTQLEGQLIQAANSYRGTFEKVNKICQSCGFDNRTGIRKKLFDQSSALSILILEQDDQLLNVDFLKLRIAENELLAVLSKKTTKQFDDLVTQLEDDLLTSSAPLETKNKIKKVIAEYSVLFKTLFNAELQKTKLLQQLDVATNNVQLAAGSLEREISHVLEQRRTAAEETAQGTSTTLTWGLVGVVIIALAGAMAATSFLIRGMTRPIALLSQGVERVSSGDLETKLAIQSGDEFESFANSFNGMLEQLNVQNKESERRDWLKTGVAQINEILQGDHELKALSQNSLKYLAERCQSQMGAIYVNNSGLLERSGAYACGDKSELPKHFRIGEGFLGEIAKSGKVQIIDELDEVQISVDFGVLQAKPQSIMFLPLEFEHKNCGVLVLASVQRFDESASDFLRATAPSLAVAINSCQSRLVMERLLKKTQEQTSALQIQNDEIVGQQRILDEKNQELEQANRHKSEFLAAISHELRTPLNATIGYTSLTLRDLRSKIPETNLRDLERAERSAKSLLQLINDVLDFSKIEAGKVETYLEIFNIAEPIEDCAAIAEGNLLQKDDVELKLEIEDDLPEVNTDMVKIEQILNNLIGNAIKFTSEGAVTIRANAIDDRSAIKLEIADTGVGIPQEKLETIFEVFRQVDGSITKKFGGTGLGLAICRSFSSLLGIDLSIKSAVGEGTTFTLIIPREFQGPIAEIKSPVRAVTPTPVAQPRPPTTKSKKRTMRFNAPVTPRNTVGDAIVAVRASSKTSDELSAFLSTMPLRIEHRESLAEIHELCRSHPVWSIVIDASLDCFDELTKLRNDPATESIPVVVCGSIENDIQFPRIECITRPLEKTAVIEALARAGGPALGDALIVEDNESIRDLYSRVLSGLGYNPIGVGDGHSALEYLKEETPRVIFLDLLIPQLDGFGVLENILRHEELLRVPVVVITGKELTAEERGQLKRGAQQIFEKGRLGFTELTDKIRSLSTEIERSRGRSILIVDDNDLNLDLISRLFENDHFLVHRASSGQEGIDLACRHQVDAILMDLAMPEMDGFEAIAKLQENAVAAETTIIACSAFATSEWREKAMSAGCEGFITKPVEPEKLVSQVRKIVLNSKIKKFLCQQSS